MTTHFISGHGDVTEAEFALHYKEKIDKAILKGHSFVIGDFRGLDSIAQEYLSFVLGKDAPNRVTVYHMHKAPRVNNGFPTKGGFKSDEERDAAMTEASNKDIAWVRKGKHKSGTKANILRRKGKKLEINTHNMTVSFGRHQGELYTRIPVSYLLWMINVEHTYAHIAHAEIKRRGTVLPSVEVSHHAIDRFSQKFLKKWLEANSDKGIAAYLHELAEKVWFEYAADRANHSSETIYFEGINFVFEIEGRWPVLKTVK